jgi:hypothetical protein
MIQNIVTQILCECEKEIKCCRLILIFFQAEMDNITKEKLREDLYTGKYTISGFIPQSQFI